LNLNFPKKKFVTKVTPGDIAYTARRIARDIADIARYIVGGIAMFLQQKYTSFLSIF
jgi:hypothetical protein